MQTFITTFQDKTTRIFWNIETKADNVDDAVKMALADAKRLEAIDECWDLVRCAVKEAVVEQGVAGGVGHGDGEGRARLH